MPAGPEERLVGAHERDGDPLLGQAERPPEERGVRLRVGDDEVGPAEGAVVDRAEDPRGGRAGPEATAVADERVVERDERVEDDRPATRRPLRGGHVEVPGIADDDDVGVVVPSPRERALRAGHPRELPETERPVVATPDLPVPLDHRHARAPQARDDLRVAGGRAVVRPEVERLHPLPQDLVDEPRRAGRRARAAARGAGS